MNQRPARPGPRPGVLDIAAYVPGRSKAPEGVRLHKLSSNETPLGPSPAALAAYREAGAKLDVYPDGAQHGLRAAIAAAYGLNPERIVCGAGSDDLLFLLAHAFVGHGEEGIYTEHGFAIYPIAIRAAGGTVQLIIVLLMFMALLVAIIAIEQGQRRIPVEFAKRPFRQKFLEAALRPLSPML